MPLSRFFTRLLVLFSITTSFCINIYSQSDPIKVRKSSLSVGFVNSTLKQDGFPELKSNYGASLTLASSYYFWTLANNHLRFGADLSFCDITYTNYKVEMKMFDGSVHNYGIHEAEFGIQAGIGIDYAITQKVGLHATARYAPSYSLLHSDYNGLNPSETVGSFGNFFVGGLTLRYRRIGLGIEARFGQTKYKKLFNFDDDEDDEVLSSGNNSHIGQANDKGKINSKIKGFRSFITLYF
mgnify:CR=1 FL=1